MPKNAPLNTRQNEAGRLLLVGWEGIDEGEPISLLEEVRPAGFIFFARNFPGSFERLKDQLGRIKEEGRKILKRQILLAIDHEGGSVNRLPLAEAILPSAREAGSLLALGKRELVARMFSRASAFLMDLGFNFNLAPVVDVALEDSFIGGRSFGDGPREVLIAASLFCRCFADSGLLVCGKHFPGLGSATLDPHVELPIISRTIQDLWEIDGLPYRGLIKMGLDAIMTTHAIYRSLDPLLPATYSSKIVDLIKKDYAFKGLVLTDDLEMGALKGIFTLGESASEAVIAGHDLCLVCHKRENVLAAHEGLLKAISDYRITPSRVLKSVKRLNRTLKALEERSNN
ncbi:MAG: hypothetical protein LBE38_08995 [Deltaproteobacteria bacterium]|jgi:beta-N-acetylhexosaminidase|nr:hypothetical protein [Deltaproteobacteria bacterium]